MSAKHTEGPWTVNTPPDTYLCVYSKHPDGRLDRHICGDVDSWPNARLIAAAPEMLAALREIHEIMEEAMHPDAAETEINLCDLIGTASRAIAKATGEA